MDPKKFLHALETGEAESAFYKELKECRDFGITGFPTFYIKNNSGEGILLTGYQRFEAFERIFKKLVGDKLAKRTVTTTEENITNFIEKYRKVTAKEVAEVFEMEMKDAEKMLMSLERKGKIVRVEAGNGYFWLSARV